MTMILTSLEPQNTSVPTGCKDFFGSSIAIGQNCMSLWCSPCVIGRKKQSTFVYFHMSSSHFATQAMELIATKRQKFYRLIVSSIIFFLSIIRPAIFVCLLFRPFWCPFFLSSLAFYRYASLSTEHCLKISNFLAQDFSWVYENLSTE